MILKGLKEDFPSSSTMVVKEMLGVCLKEHIELLKFMVCIAVGVGRAWYLWS